MRSLLYLSIYTVLLVTPAFSQEVSVDEELGELINIQLADAEVDYRVAMLETYTTGDTVGTTIVFNARDKKLSHHFVANDPRRAAWSGDPTLTEDDITMAIDGTEASTLSGLGSADVIPAIWRAMDTWNGVKSSHIPIVPDGRFFGPVTPLNFGIVQRNLGFGGRRPIPIADIFHAGFLPVEFFETLVPGGGTGILGVTITFNFIGPGGPTDINNDGRGDVAFREIYYNDHFPWAIDGNIDVETVVLHETGHGLSQGHFGKLFRTNSNGKIHFAPRAIMNPSYTGVQQALKGTDKGGHSSIWASWPNN